jgi:hypothetical protein
LHNKCHANSRKQEHKQQQQAQTTTKKHSSNDMCTTHHTLDNRWTSSKLSRLAEPVTSSPVTKEQAQATTTRKYHFASTPKIKRMIDV